jgi:hypothetical protein
MHRRMPMTALISDPRVRIAAEWGTLMAQIALDPDAAAHVAARQDSEAPPESPLGRRPVA